MGSVGRRGRAVSLGTIGLGLVISAVFGYVAVRGARLGEVWTALRGIEAGWLVAALGAFVLWFFIRALRWRSLFEHGRRPSVPAVTEALFAGYLFNNILPVRAGEAVRVAVLHRRARASVAESAATVVLERVFDILSLLVLLFVMTPWLPSVSWLGAAVALAATLVVVVGLAVFVLARWGERPFGFVFRQLARLPLLGKFRLDDAASNLGHGLLGLRRVSTAAVAFGWTTLSWVVLGVSFWFVMLAFDLELSPLAGELVVIAVGLAMILPSSPAALGVFEGATVVVLQSYGISDSEALSYAVVLHAVNLVPFLVLGLPMLVALRRRPAAGHAGRLDDGATSPAAQPLARS